jgi:lactate dehydrogenase-like 2-hydroxyacid dehydrogenase
MEPRLLIAAPLTESVIARATTQFGAVCSQERQLTVDELIGKAADLAVPALLVSARMKLGAADIARLPETVGLLATCSVGYEHIDIEAARRRGIAVTNTPDVLTEATADLTMMLMLCASRRAREYDTIMRNGWRRVFGLNEMLGVQISGKTLGIIGMGRIGRAVARRARGFGMTIHYHDQARNAEEDAAGAVFHSTIEDLLETADVVTLHTPGSAMPLLSRERIARMRPGAILVNAARGALVDEEALIEALNDRRLAAAGLDTYAREPDFDLRFNDLPNVFLTPHVGSATLETRDAMGMRALDNIGAFLRGEPLPDRVN